MLPKDKEFELNLKANDESFYFQEQWNSIKEIKNVSSINSFKFPNDEKSTTKKDIDLSLEGFQVKKIQKTFWYHYKDAWYRVFKILRIVK